MGYRLGLLDQSPIAEGMTAADALAQTVELACLAEASGYFRFWVSEHHNTDLLAGSSPEVLIAWLLSHTRHIRIGSGGVMLQHYSPYKVAENFHVLSSLAPGRVDVGIGKAPGGFPLATQALQQEIAPAHQVPFADKLRQLDALLEPASAQQAELRATPLPPQAPERFLLGASAESARLAASLGWHFVFAGFIQPSESLLTETLLTWREYQPEQAQALLSLSVIVAESHDEAKALAGERYNYKVYIEDRAPLNVLTQEQADVLVQQSGSTRFRIEKQAQNILYGTTQEVHRQLQHYHQRFGINEFIIHTPVHDPAARLASIRGLAAGLREPDAR
ncbi:MULTISPECIES: LLM class flavin-dependent oxidoreductase [Dickeya]|uniref:Bacterial luciferase family protein YtmO, in cluster with L-cystine ABC transporter n=1 Tax=Dickeya aquatica TaxID=1401087 RepID=A0A375AF82_9GAMM|nr:MULTISPECIES: LLM class flavin-dependent oxidoreductase [Dickeya]SLM64733.1 Bacterial luciferase family protein YtmO, in cluster with L-cystine ABC transporter [Dickeya aquatica]